MRVDPYKYIYGRACIKGGTATDAQRAEVAFADAVIERYGLDVNNVFLIELLADNQVQVSSYIDDGKGQWVNDGVELAVDVQTYVFSRAVLAAYLKAQVAT